jgi:hypothetical protein
MIGAQIEFPSKIQLCCQPVMSRRGGRRWITAEWGVSENNLRAKFYKLTRAGGLLDTGATRD